MWIKINENKDEKDDDKWNERGKVYLNKRNQWWGEITKVCYKLQFCCCKSKWNSL